MPNKLKTKATKTKQTTTKQTKTNQSNIQAKEIDVSKQHQIQIQKQKLIKSSLNRQSNHINVN